MTDHYTVTLQWEPADQCFVARVAELPGCMADGRTRREAVKAVSFAIREWIAATRSLGLSVPHAAEHTASLTLRQVSVVSGVSEAMLRQHIARGELQAVRNGRTWRVSPVALADFERARQPGDRRSALLVINRVDEMILKDRVRRGDRAAKAILAAARGASSAQIAARLGIAERTARTYVERFRRQR